MLNKELGQRRRNLGLGVDTGHCSSLDSVHGAAVSVACQTAGGQIVPRAVRGKERGKREALGLAVRRLAAFRTSSR
jgi:hypothetical protein